jgi:hypothetical protein
MFERIFGWVIFIVCSVVCAGAVIAFFVAPMPACGPWLPAEEFQNCQDAGKSWLPVIALSVLIVADVFAILGNHMRRCK